MTVERAFETREALAEELASAVAEVLEGAIAERGRASLVVSGGSTPVPFFRALRTRTLPWDRVTVTLADDRWVPAGHERSNERLVRRELLVDDAAPARFVGLVNGARTPEEGLGVAEQRISEVPRPFDVVVLGMGTDGHTASLFPDAVETPAALDAASPASCAAVHPPGDLEPRVSLTLAALIDARRVFLHITGKEKREIYQRATEHRLGLPVDSVLRAAGERAAVVWAP